MNFEETHETFISSHIQQRTGERKGRLERGHLHGEKLFTKNVWWPMKGNFDDLHPEYEVLDWRGRSYFGDFAYIQKYLKLIIEIKGYNAHVKEMDRQRYSNELNRELFMQITGFRIISFTYDDVSTRPELCITLLRSLLSRYHPEISPITKVALTEKEIIRLAIYLARPIRPVDVVKHLAVNRRTAVSILQSLCTKGWMLPLQRGQGARVLYYELVHGVVDMFY